MSELTRICVFCGSKPGARPVFLQHAFAVGRAIAQAGCDLVYGGAADGLMGALADGALEEKGRVIGVIPSGLVRTDNEGRGAEARSSPELAQERFAHPRLSACHVTESMHERKALMHELSGAFLALPGGFGTLDELCETITWGQLGLHRKPIGLLDTEGYFQPLLQWVARAVDDGFVSPAHQGLLVVDSQPQALVDRLRQHTPPKLPVRWVTR